MISETISAQNATGSAAAVQQCAGQLLQKRTLFAECVAQRCAGLVIQLFRQLHGTVNAEQGDKSRFAIFAVAANGFAQLLGGPGHVQHIVHDLEHQTDAISIR